MYQNATIAWTSEKGYGFVKLEDETHAYVPSTIINKINIQKALAGSKIQVKIEKSGLRNIVNDILIEPVIAD